MFIHSSSLVALPTHAETSTPARAGSLKKFLNRASHNSSRASIGSSDKRNTIIAPRSVSTPKQKDPESPLSSSHTPPEKSSEAKSPTEADAKEPEATPTESPDKEKEAHPPIPPRMSEPEPPNKNPLNLQGQESDLFWNVTLARNFYERAQAGQSSGADAEGSQGETHGEEGQDGGVLAPVTSGLGGPVAALLRPSQGLRRQSSVLSKLSIERSGSESGSDRRRSNEA